MYESHSFKAARAAQDRTDGSVSSHKAGWNYSLKAEIRFALIIISNSYSVVK